MRMLRRLAASLVLVAGLGAPAVAHATRSVYVTNSGTASTGLAAFTGPDGPLTAVAGTPLATGNDPDGVMVSPDARHVYVANTGDDSISRYSIDAGGKPAALGDTSTGGNQPTGLGFTPDGKFLFATNRDSTEAAPSVSAFSVNASTGALTLVNGLPVDIGVHDPRAPVVSPDGRFLYVTARRGPLGPPPSNADSMIAVLSIGADGSLTPTAGSPFDIPLQVNAFGASIAPDGSRLFVAEATTNKIDVLDLDPITGAPSPVAGSPFAGGASAPTELSVTPDGTALYVTETFGKAVEGFTINPATGALTQIPGTPLVLTGQTHGVAITPDGKDLYAALLNDPGLVAGLAIGSMGGLTSVTGSPFPTGGTFPSFFSAAVTPTQTPVPAFSSSAGKAGTPTSFDASATTVPGGSPTSFVWDFGDGTAPVAAGASRTHTYAVDGTYTVKLTVTNDCDPSAVFTGSVASVGNAVYCNGLPQATVSHQVTIDSVADGKLKAKSTQKQKGHKILVAVKVVAGEQLTAALKGTIKRGKHSYKLAPKTKTVAAGSTTKLKLKPKKKKARKKLKKALRKGHKAKAKVTATFTDGAGNAATGKVKVTLKG